MSGIFHGVDSTGNYINRFPFFQSSSYLTGTHSSYNYHLAFDSETDSQANRIVSGFFIIEGILVPETDSFLTFNFSTGYNTISLHPYGMVTIEANSFGILKTIL